MMKLLSGRVVVREILESSPLWRPDDNPREVHTHRGVVLAMGKPATVEFLVEGRTVSHEVPHGFAVGDVVQYHLAHNQAAFTVAWEDGLPCTWITQGTIDAVVEA